MTFLEAKGFVKGYGLTLSKKDGEYRVNFKDGKEATAYYTNDMQDAVDTAYWMMKRNRL